MRIVHFSDTHVFRAPRDVRAFLDKRLLGVINFSLRRQSRIDYNLFDRAVSTIKSLAPDVVVCTGDLTAVGTPQEFADVLDVLAPLRNNPAFDFIFVPGNHDAYVPRKRCKESLRETFYELNSGRWKLDDLPVTLEKDNLRFFVVNQAQPTNLFSSAGITSDAELEQLRTELNAPRKTGEKRLMISHYPTLNGEGHRLPWPRRHTKDRQFMKILDDGQIDILLSGHVHTPFKHVQPNSTLQISAGALTIYGQINVLEYSPQTGTFRQYWKDIKKPQTPRPDAMESQTLLQAKARE